jgi:hypothetical protein
MLYFAFRNNDGKAEEGSAEFEALLPDLIFKNIIE